MLTGYSHGAVALSLLMFTLLTVFFGVFIGWLRLASGSVFVAAMAHASFNAFVQSFFGASFDADKAWFWMGDYGVLTLIPYGLLVAWLYWSRRVHAAFDEECVNPMTTPPTMRCSEPGHRAVVAIHASRGPGHQQPNRAGNDG